MADIEPLFPNMPIPTVARPPLALTRQTEPEIEPWMDIALDQARAGRRVAWIVATLLIVVVGAQAAAIAVMLPLKEVVPYTVIVDRQTGYVETARGVQLGDLAEDRAIVESMLAQYVLGRETFDPTDFPDRYSRIALWSLGPARDEYVAQYQPNTPDSALIDMKPGGRIRVTVKSVEILSPETARVRFETQRTEPGGEPLRTDRQAAISYRFTGAPMRNEDRIMNPLGFQVTSYRRDNETPANANPAPPISGAKPIAAPPISGAKPAPPISGAKIEEAPTQ
jgi:type IV secretion system protein VirB8